MALLASGIYLEDKNMAVMNGTGGIDQQITNRITSAGGNPQKLMGQYGNTKSILDLIAAQRAADLVKQQKQQVALAMNSNPPTVADQLEKELVDGQKAEMRGPLEGLKNLRGDQAQGDKTRGVAGVLANQQRMAQQQRPTMRAAMGGIINAPAPNLNRMYNGGIVGYAEGGEIDEDAFRARVRALVKKSGMSAEKATAQARAEFGPGGSFFGRNKYGIRFPSEINKDPRGAKFLDREEIPESRTAEDEQLDRLNALSEEPYSTQRLLGTTRQLGTTEMGMGRQPIAEDMNQGLGAMDNLKPYDEQYGASTGTEEELTDIGKTKTEAAALAAAEAARLKTKKAEGDKSRSPMEQLQQDTEKAFDPFANANANANAGIASVLPEGNGMSPVMTRKERGEKALQDLGLDKKQDISALEPFIRKPEVNPNQSPIMTPEQQAEANKPLSGSAAIQAKLDAMRGKKGLAGLVERFANTNFQKSYGGTGEALAQAGRDIAKTGSDEKARERKSLEDQLGVQQAIEAADVAAKRDREKFDITEGRLSQKMSIDDKNTVAEIALRANTDRNAALARLAKLNLDIVNAEGAQEYKMASLALQEQANTIREKGNTTAVQKVVQGYVNSATNFYKGLLANAQTPEETAAIKQELQSEISRIVGILGPDGALDLKALQKTSAGATAPDSGFSGFEKEE